MTNTESRDELIDRLRAFPGHLKEVVKNLTDDQLDILMKEGGWTFRQMVHHICDADMVGFIRMKTMLTVDSPDMRGFDQDAWVGFADSRKSPIEISLHIVRVLRERWSDMLDGLEENAWTRKGKHEERGEFTVVGILAHHVWHGEHHAEQIVKCRELKGW